MNARPFLRWWLEELLALLPARLRERMSGSSGRVIDLEHFSPGPGAARGPVALSIPAAHAIRRVVELPLAAERNLRAVLGFEMDRYTPFSADRVYYDYEVRSRHPERGQVCLELRAVPRERADPALARARALGLEPRALDLGDARIALLPDRPQGLRWQLGALLLLASALLVAAVSIPIARKAAVLESLEEDVRRARADARLAEEARARLARAVEEEHALPAQRSGRPAAIDVLDDLSRHLPDGTWLTHFELAGPRVRIRGESSNAGELLAVLEGSALLRRAALDGSVVRDPEADRERFAITATAQFAEAR